MSPGLSPLITPKELLSLQPKENFILVDACFGRQEYEEKHLLGAVHVDLNSQLSDIKEDVSQGGRHPLPEPREFSETLGSLGITPESHVVVYDNKNGSNAAARFWWMLRAIGHSKIQVLDGGRDAAIHAGYPKSSVPTNPEPTAAYPLKNWDLPLADIAQVEQAAKDEDHLVVDVRESDRYLGKIEPIDNIAGHIPGAVNIPFSENLDKEGFFLSPSELKEKYHKAFNGVKAENTIVHCGSGVTACHTLLALAISGMEIPSLYVGSWSEWSRNERPIATGNRF